MDEISGGSFVHTSAIADFEICLYDWSLDNSRCFGIRLSWSNKSYDGVLILKKLDRVMVLAFPTQ